MTADAAIKMLQKSKADIEKLIEQLEGHSTKAKAKAEKALRISARTNPDPW